MGTLEPGKKIVYERDGDTVYGRYEGEPASNRWVVGKYIPYKEKK